MVPYTPTPCTVPLGALLIPCPMCGAGGYPALFCRGHIVHHVLRGFNEQHVALRERVHVLRGATKELSTHN